MRKLLAGAALAGVLLGVGAGTASAAQPAVKGCFGASVSGDARVLVPYGQVVLAPNAPRNDFGSIGDAVQAIQAGQVPADVFPNSCS